MKSLVFASKWIPARKPSKKLLLVLHGRGDSYEGFAWLPAALGYEDVNYLMLNAPDPYYGGYSWYDLPPDQGPGIARSSRALDQLFAELEEAGYPARETILLGFSQGCLMALEWGGRSERRLAGFVALSGYAYDEKKLAAELSDAARQGNWLVTHGKADEVLPYSFSARQIAYLQSQGMPLEFHTFMKGHTIDDAEELPLLRAWMRARWDA